MEFADDEVKVVRSPVTRAEMLKLTPAGGMVQCRI